MENPSVINTLRDNDKNVTYNVYAYRALTRDELLHAVAAYLRGRRQPRNATVEIRTTIGMTG